MKYVNVYELDKHYGGPEEGGWWFDSGTFDQSLSVAFQDNVSDKSVNAFAVALDNSLRDEADENRVPAVGSVLYKGGRYAVRVEEGEGQDWPEERPHYS